MRFTKMQGCGNDYVYVNCLEETVENPTALAIAMSERHFGVGADGLVLILPSDTYDFTMRMFNADGSEGEMCGNAIRCIGKYVYERGLTKKDAISIDTLGGVKHLQMTVENDLVTKVRVDMGEPILEASLIPVRHSESPVLDKKIVADGTEFSFICVSMGNPHAVTFVDDVANFPVEQIGKQIENHADFPNRTNVEFVEVVSRNCVKMRVWERGSGETMACGTGACASAMATILAGLTDDSVELELLGGKLWIEYNREENRIYMSGEAEFSFDGIWLK